MRLDTDSKSVARKRHTVLRSDENSMYIHRSCGEDVFKQVVEDESLVLSVESAQLRGGTQLQRRLNAFAILQVTSSSANENVFSAGLRCTLSSIVFGRDAKSGCCVNTSVGRCDLGRHTVPY